MKFLKSYDFCRFTFDYQINYILFKNFTLEFVVLLKNKLKNTFFYLQDFFINKLKTKIIKTITIFISPYFHWA